jgi:tRNA dimethylallyltransferase
MKIEVIPCDSMQVYRSMPLLSQAPPASTLKLVRHHLIGCRSPSRRYQVAEFIRLTRELITQIEQRQNLPLIVGGTPFYVSALLDGLFVGPGQHQAFRRSLERRSAKVGSTVLHEELRKKDAPSAEKIHPHDLRRIIRALEVNKVTGKRFSDLKKDRKGLWGDHIRMYGLWWPREILYDRINRRVNRMFRQGVVNEVKLLKKKRLSLTAKACLGLQEISLFLKGEMKLPETRSLIAQNTRRYAKAQLSWLRRDDRIHWIKMEGKTPAQAAREIVFDFNQWKK